jgi:hypothetical protein
VVTHEFHRIGKLRTTIRKSRTTILELENKKQLSFAFLKAKNALICVFEGKKRNQ